MELKLIKHDEALKELKEFWSAGTTEQRAYIAPYHLRARDSKKMMDRTTEYRKWQSHELKLIKHDEALKDLAGQLKEVWSA